MNQINGINLLHSIKVFCLMFSAVLGLELKSNAQTIIKDQEDVYGVWTKENSPYIVQGEAVVPKGKSLKIEPGVEINFQGDKRFGIPNEKAAKSAFRGFLIVRGSLSAIGTVSNQIIFTSSETDTYWGGLFFIDSENNQLKNCVFSYVDFPWLLLKYNSRHTVEYELYGAISGRNSSVTIENSIFHHLKWGGVHLINSNVKISHSVFYHIGYKPLFTLVDIKNSIFWRTNESIPDSTNNREKYFLDTKSFVFQPYKREITDFANGIVEEPGFVDSENENFRLLPNSPLRGIGKNGADLGIDYTSDALPPVISVEEVSFSQGLIKANSSTYLEMRLKNIGPGDANSVMINLSGDYTGLSFPQNTIVETIAKNGGERTVKIPFYSDKTLPSGEALVYIEIMELDFEIKIRPKQLKFRTQKLPQPKLQLAQFGILESSAADANEQINLNEIVEVHVAVQNVGFGKATEVVVSVTNDQNGIRWLGTGETMNDMNKEQAYFSTIGPGKYKVIKNFFFINSNFDVKQPLKFNIKVNESLSKYGFEDVKEVSIASEIETYENIEVVNTNEEPATVVIEDVPELQPGRGRGGAEKKKVILEVGDYYALLIGVQDYVDPEIDDLAYPVADINSLKNVLTARYTFKSQNVKTLENPSESKLLKELENFGKRVKPNDNLLVFFAGHGKWIKSIQQGYWLPADAEDGNRSKWISNSTIRDYIRGIKSQHTLLISDACFSGGIFKGRNVEEKIAGIKKLHQVPSRRAITSGAKNEVVPDNSVFLKYFVKKLKENNERFLDSQSLFTDIRPAVVSNSETTPLDGYIVDAEHEGGDFIFIRKE